MSDRLLALVASFEAGALLGTVWDACCGGLRPLCCVRAFGTLGGRDALPPKARAKSDRLLARPEGRVGSLPEQPSQLQGETKWQHQF